MTGIKKPVAHLKLTGCFLYRIDGGSCAIRTHDHRIKSVIWVFELL